MTIDELRQYLLDLRGRNGCTQTWEKVFEAMVPEHRREHVSPATLWKIAKEPGYEPKDELIREILGLDPESPVTFVDGQHKPRAQALDVTPCECGRYFVSNHPRRRRCFVCSPYRGKDKRQKGK